ncbi:MAG TPA: DNA-directed RNA polymerase subunit omega [Vicinamibacterales bacterium]|nr:DNA-directed RNA polymerase subunit omega [Vicinamibacterales bacterium]
MEDATEYTAEFIESEPAGTDDAPVVPVEPAPPITSRFLYVDVAALRAKQLRRGARLRYDVEPGTPTPKKPERQAMEEVKRCLVQYTIPPWKGVGVRAAEEAARAAAAEAAE